MTIFRPQNEKEKKSKCDKSKIKKSQRPKFERHQEDTSLDGSLFTSRSIDILIHASSICIKKYM